MSNAIRNALHYADNKRTNSRTSFKTREQMLMEQIEQKIQLLKDLRQLEHRVLQELYDLERQQMQHPADKYCKDNGYVKQQTISNSPIPPYKGVGLENVEQFCRRHRFITSPTKASALPSKTSALPSKALPTKASPPRPRVLQVVRHVSNRRIPV